MGQARKKFQTLEEREKTRQHVLSEAIGELSIKESKKLRMAKVQHQEHFRAVMKEIHKTEENLQFMEKQVRQIGEVAGTFDISKIIAKYISRQDTFNNLKTEFAEAESRMKKLKDK